MKSPVWVPRNVLRVTRDHPPDLLVDVRVQPGERRVERVVERLDPLAPGRHARCCRVVHHVLRNELLEHVLVTAVLVLRHEPLHHGPGVLTHH